MKANKALKRLAKIEALISDVTERYSARAPQIREVLDGAAAAVARAREAVSLQASSSKATKVPAGPKRRISQEGIKRIIAATKKRWALKRAEAAKAQAPAKKAAPIRKKAAVKRAAVKAAARGGT